jgi:hypothetical protein
MEYHSSKLRSVNEISKGTVEWELSSESKLAQKSFMKYTI